MKQYTSNNNDSKGIVYSKRNDYSYEREDNKLLSFFIWTFTVILVVSIIALFSTITVRADSIGYSEYAYTVPTALCYDPLLGMSFVIYTDCSVGTEDHKDNDDLHGVNEVIPTSDVVVTTEEIIPVNDVVIPDNDIVVPVDDTVEEPEKGNPGNDKNVGNAGEKCDKNMCENVDGVTGEHGKSHKD